MNTLTKIEIFNDSLEAKHYSKSTIEQYSSIIQKFISHPRCSGILNNSFVVAKTIITFVSNN